jgi:hypothetical protein
MAMAKSATLAVPRADRLAKLVRLLASDNDGEVIATRNAILRLLGDEGQDLHDLADLLTAENSGPTPGDVEAAYREGYRDGVHDAGESELLPAQGMSWHEQARFCAERADRLKEYERDFVEQMVRWTGRGREPSEKQGRWLDALYNRLKKSHARKRSRR